MVELVGIEHHDAAFLLLTLRLPLKLRIKLPCRAYLPTGFTERTLATACCCDVQRWTAASACSSKVHTAALCSQEEWPARAAVEAKLGAPMTPLVPNNPYDTGLDKNQANF